MADEVTWSLNTAGTQLTHTDLPPSLSGSYITQPYPSFWWYLQNNELINNSLKPRMSGSYITAPYPLFWWYLDNNDFANSGLKKADIFGTFRNSKIEEVEIPESVKFISDYAFYGTNLRTVTIARDCVIGLHSFPENCHVNTYA